MKVHQTQTIHTFPDILVLSLQLTYFFLGFLNQEQKIAGTADICTLFVLCLRKVINKNKPKYCWRHVINWNFPLLCTLYKGFKDKSQFLVIRKWKQWKPEKTAKVEFIGHVGFFLTILLAKIANERLKMLAS